MPSHNAFKESPFFVYHIWSGILLFLFYRFFAKKRKNQSAKNPFSVTVMAAVSTRFLSPTSENSFYDQIFRFFLRLMHQKFVL